MQRAVVIPARNPRSVIASCFAIGMLLLVILACQTARGQQDGAGEVGGEAGKAPAAKAVAPAAPAADDADAARRDESALVWLIKALGWPYVLAFLAISFTFVAILVMSILSARRDAFAPPELIEGFETKLNEQDVQGAYDMASVDESILGRILSAGLSRLGRGYAKAMEGMQEVGEDENMKIEHRLSYIALIGTISPMVGLLGTVDGMVRSFRVIVRSGATPKASDLAEGISTALLTTLVGLLIAIPALAAYHILRNRVSRLFLEVGIASENLMSRFESVQPKGTIKKG